MVEQKLEQAGQGQEANSTSSPVVVAQSSLHQVEAAVNTSGEVSNPWLPAGVRHIPGASSNKSAGAWRREVATKPLS